MIDDALRLNPNVSLATDVVLACIDAHYSGVRYTALGLPADGRIHMHDVYPACASVQCPSQCQDSAATRTPRHTLAVCVAPRDPSQGTQDDEQVRVPRSLHTGGWGMTGTRHAPEVMIR